jgi:hypothetical protein
MPNSHLPQPDWLAHRLTVHGDVADLLAFRGVAGGSGIVPWRHDPDAMAEDWFHLMLAPPPHRRTISVMGARVLAGQLRDAIGEAQSRAAARQHVRSSPFDLHAVAPVPPSVLRLGADAPDSLDWMRMHWGTVWPLRRVVEVVPPGEAKAFAVDFWSADWTPWPVISALRKRFPALSIGITPHYQP